MRRANTFDVRPLSHRGRLALIELLDSSAACFNELNYDRRQAYFSARYDADDHHTVSELKTLVRDAASQEEYRNKYIQQLSSSIPQQLERKNSQTWDGFFELLRKYRDPEDDEVTDEPSPPGYWKEDDNRRLHTVIRNDTYSLELGERSRLEIPLGKELKEKYGYGYHEKLRLEVRGRPHWEGPNGSLELVYDRTAETFTARHSVGRRHTDPVRRFTDTPALATTSGEDDGVVAAVDIGANNLAAVVTSEGDHVVFHGRPCFERFHDLTTDIADLQSHLPENRYTSERIERLYRRRQEQRDHAQDALVRHLARWLVERGVEELYVGDLDDVREEHWSATVNEKTDLFWAHGRFRDRLGDVLEGECGITVHEESEAGTSSTCPSCGGENVQRSGDRLQCLSCGFKGHSDVVGAVNFIVEQAEVERGGPMARPAARGQNSPRDAIACLEWDDHRWRHRDQSTKEDPANRSTHGDVENLASGGTGTA
jgi:putative transposase